jgi:hypothetical protein
MMAYVVAHWVTVLNWVTVWLLDWASVATIMVVDGRALEIVSVEYMPITCASGALDFHGAATPVIVILIERKVICEGIVCVACVSVRTRRSSRVTNTLVGRT